MQKSMIMIACLIATGMAHDHDSESIVPEDEFADASVGATCTCCGKSVTKPSCSITLFQHCNYGGYRIPLAPGSYNMNTLISKGMKNDDLSSVQIHGSCTAHLYQHINYGGKVLTKTASDSCFTNDWMIPVAQLAQIEVKHTPPIDEHGRRLLGRRKVSWNDQISSAKVTDRSAHAHSCGQVCIAPCAQEKAAKAEASTKEKARKAAAAERAAKAAAKEKADKEKAAKAAEKKQKEAVTKEKDTKEKAIKAAEKKEKEAAKREKDAKEKAKKAKQEKDKKAAEKKEKEAATKEKAAKKKKERETKEARTKEKAAKMKERDAKKKEKDTKEKAMKAEKAKKEIEAKALKKEKEQKEVEAKEKEVKRVAAKKEKAAKKKEKEEKKAAKKAAAKQAALEAAMEKKSKIPPADPCKAWKKRKAANALMTKSLQKKVRFEPGKTILTKAGKKILDEVASVIVSNAWMSISLTGQSTAKGSWCNRLTKGRAKSAADYLKKKGCTNKMATSGKCQTFIGLSISAGGSAKPPTGCKEEAADVELLLDDELEDDVEDPEE